MFKTSQSKVNTWNKCHRAYHYRYVERLRRKRKPRPLQFGSMVHDILDAHFNGNEWMDVLETAQKTQGKLFRSEVEEYGDIINDVRIIMTEYFNYWPEKDLVPIKMRGKFAEFSFEVKVARDLIAVGRLDMLGKHNKLKWLVEHKSFSRKPNADHRWRNLQSVLYIRIVELADLPAVDGICWDYIGSHAPSEPQLLKGGGISKKKLNSLPLKVEEFLEGAGYDPGDQKFKGMIKSLEHNRRNYFDRIYTPVKPQVVDQVFADFIDASKQMAELHGTKKDRNIGRHCDWCDYEGLCRAALQGLDTKDIRKKEYEVHEKDNEDEGPDFEA